MLNYESQGSQRRLKQGKKNLHKRLSRRLQLALFVGGLLGGTFMSPSFRNLLMGDEAFAETLTFPAAWKQISEKSPIQKSMDMQVEASQQNLKMASRHWLPRLYLDAKGYKTNDPGAAFFGLLEQRQLTSADFNPDGINHPEAQTFHREALGLDLPLFEGGMKVAQERMSEAFLDAQKDSRAQVKLDQYANVGLAYGSLVALTQQKEKLETLKEEMNQLLKKYRLGNKSNPVGYSGLLGMKSLLNRLEGLLHQYEAQRKSYFISLKEMGVASASWSPEVLRVETFVSKYLGVEKTQSNSSSKVAKNIQESSNSESYSLSAMRKQLKAGKEKVNMETARYLPRLGVFAESYLFHGDRDSSNGYSAGLYVQWNLFDSAVYGGVKEAKLSWLASQNSIEAMAQKERAEVSSYDAAIQALKENLDLLEKSDGFMVEQSRVARTLFRNGSINALQMVEILNRRTDLIDQTTQAELKLVNTAAQVFTKKPTSIH